MDLSRTAAMFLCLGLVTWARPGDCQELDPAMIRSDPSPAWVKILGELRRAATP
ncbi:MAG: hypothetical protein V2A76_03370 [Planctomycetota bacterium]